MSKYRTQLEEYLKGIEVNADRVVDIGGGALPVKGRVKSWLVGEYHIWDNGLESLKRPADVICDLNLPLENADKVEPYDVAFCLEVMEYIWNPVQAIINLNYLLAPSGILYISFPFVYPNHQPIESDYLRYTPFGAMKLLVENGFDIQDLVYRKDMGGKLNEFYKYDGMHVGRFADVTGVIIKAVKK